MSFWEWLTIYEPDYGEQAQNEDPQGPDLAIQVWRNGLLRDKLAYDQQGHYPAHQHVDGDSWCSGTLIQVHSSCLRTTKGIKVKCNVRFWSRLL